MGRWTFADWADVWWRDDSTGPHDQRLRGQVGCTLGLMDAAARCIADPRSPLLIKHGVRDMLRQRVDGRALGGEDLNDHGALRQDVALQTAVGVEREVASAPTLCRREHWAGRATAWRLQLVVVDQFMARLDAAPTELVLDFDATDNPLHGQPEGRVLHGYCNKQLLRPAAVRILWSATVVRPPAVQQHRWCTPYGRPPESAGAPAAHALSPRRAP